jgi:spore coat protein U-like protein
MIRKIALAVFLFVLSGAPANAVVVCTMSATNVAFGDVSVAASTNAGLTAVGAIVLSCIGTGSTNYAIALSPGANNQYSPRQMPLINDPIARLPYNLYSETALSSIWGNGVAGTTLVNGTINMRTDRIVILPFPVYGRVEPRTVPAAGDYADIITATLALGGDNTGVNVSFQVTAHVSKHCSISATNLIFPDYTQAQLDAQSQISVTCTDATPWDVGLDGGRYPGGTIARRSMSGPGPSQLDYQLYSDPARTNVWGDRVGNDTVSGTGNGIPQRLDVYGRIPAGQDRVRDGGYVDTITATITF